jgi:hypothetical protein
MNSHSKSPLYFNVNQIIGYSEMLVEDINKDGQTQYLADLKKITQDLRPDFFAFTG